MRKFQILHCLPKTLFLPHHWSKKLPRWHYHLMKNLYICEIECPITRKIREKDLWLKTSNKISYQIYYLSIGLQGGAYISIFLCLKDDQGIIQLILLNMWWEKCWQHKEEQKTGRGVSPLGTPAATHSDVKYTMGNTVQWTWCTTLLQQYKIPCRKMYNTDVK